MEQTFGSGQNIAENTEKKKTFFDFVKEHKKEIVIGSATVCVAVVVVVIFKNITAANAQNIIEEVVAKGLKTHNDAVSVSSGVVEACHASPPPSIKPIYVSEHLRNLPAGWKASQSKIDLASQYGFLLGDNQTWVDSYAKGASLIG